MRTPKRRSLLSFIFTCHFTFITKIPGGTLLTKMSAELPSTEQIFTETSRLVPLNIGKGQVGDQCAVFVQGISVAALKNMWYGSNIAKPSQ